MAHVLLIFGGRSAEHEVSCVSAGAVHDALLEAGHRVTLVGIDRNGVWHHAPPEPRPLVAGGPEVVLEVPAGAIRLETDAISFDVVFPVLHGPFGEDGTIQGLMEMVGVPYVGSGVLGSAVAMDKVVAKRLLAHAGLPIPDYRVVRADEFAIDPATVVGQTVEALGLPVFVKPAALGSSVGVSLATEDVEVKDGIQEALRYGEKALIEEAVKGREIEVAVLEGPRASIPGEIVPESGWYDYAAKYENDTARLLVPAPLTDAQVSVVQDLAGRAFMALECRGLARVDFFFEEDGRGFLVNEVNTMPGFTPISMFPKLWEASGMSYSELTDELVRLAR